MTPDHFQMLARYNRAANARLYDVCGQLSDAERKADRKAFFTSIHGTLNHLLLGDTMWMDRFEHLPLDPLPLDSELYRDFGALSEARIDMDLRIEQFMLHLTVERLDGCLIWESVSLGKRFEHPLPLLIAHLFNHQTHHRGQVHHMLSDAGAAPPSLDMIPVLMNF